MKPIDETIRARIPASAPKPTAFTNRIATIIGWKERAIAMMIRPIHESQTGTRLRAEIRPIGIDRTIPAAVARMAIWIDSTSPSRMRTSLSAAKFGGQRRPRKIAPWVSPRTKRSKVKSSVDIA